MIRAIAFNNSAIELAKELIHIWWIGIIETVWWGERVIMNGGGVRESNITVFTLINASEGKKITLNLTYDLVLPEFKFGIKKLPILQAI